MDAPDYLSLSIAQHLSHALDKSGGGTESRLVNQSTPSGWGWGGVGICLKIQLVETDILDFWNY